MPRRTTPATPLHTLFRCAALLTAGAVLTLATSWLIAARLDPLLGRATSRRFISRPPEFAAGPEYVFLERTPRFGGDRWGVVYFSPGDKLTLGGPTSAWTAEIEQVPPRPPAFSRGVLDRFLPPAAPGSAWPQHPHKRDGTLSLEVAAVTSVGWPVRAMWRSDEEVTPFSPSPSWSSSRTIPVHRLSVPGSSFPVQLPTGIIWPGFAINSLLFAAVLLGIDRARTWAVRRRRRARGLCPGCAYPVAPAHAVCPECGTPHGALANNPPAASS